MPKGFRKDGTKLGFQKGHTFNIGKVGFWKGKKLSENTKEKMSLLKKGKIPKNIVDKSLYSNTRNLKISLSRKNKTWEEIYGIKQSLLLKRKMSDRLKGVKQSDAQRVKKHLSQLGSKGSNWKGGTTKLSKSLHNSIYWRMWREKVFKRDNYICQDCGEKGIYLEPHHKVPFSKLLIKYKIKTKEQAFKCKELWYIKNGITYCENCHIKNDYAKKQFTKKI